MTVPLVTVLVGGGVGSMEIVQSTLEAKLPVVVVKGSGRLADLLSDVYENLKRLERHDVRSFYTNSLRHSLFLLNFCSFEKNKIKSKIESILKSEDNKSSSLWKSVSTKDWSTIQKWANNVVVPFMQKVFEDVS